MENNYAEYATFMGKVLCADTQTHNLWYQTARGTRVLRLEKYFHFLAPTFLYLLIIYLFNYHAAYIISNTGGFGWFFFFFSNAWIPSVHSKSHRKHLHIFCMKEKLQVNRTKLNVKVLNKKLAKWTQQYIKKLIHHHQVGFIPKIQSCFNFRAQLIQVTTLINQRRNILIIWIQCRKLFDETQHQFIAFKRSF